MRKQKWFTKAMAGTMAVCMVGSAALQSAAPLNVLAADPVDAEWQQIQEVVSRYYGEWKNTSYSGAISNKLPNTALLGNGDVGITSYGNASQKTFLVSKGDFWTYGTGSYGDPCPPLPIGGVTIEKAKEDAVEDVNLALKKSIQVKGFHDEAGTAWDAPGEYLVDGDGKTKWCLTQNDMENAFPAWAMIDLGEKTDVSRWVVKHSEAGGEGRECNTRDFKLQYATKETPDPAVDEDWVDADVVEGNADGVTDRNLAETINTQYVRLVVTNPENHNHGNNALRLYELELYAKAKEETEVADPVAFYEKQDILNAEIQTTQQFAEVPTEMKTWLSDDKNIMVTELTSNSKQAAAFQVGTWATDNEKNKKPITAENDENSVTITRSTENKAPNDTKSHVSKAALSTKVIGADGVVASSDSAKGKGTLKFTVEPGETVYVVTAVGGGGRTYHNDGSLWEDAVEPVEDAKAVLAEVKDETTVEDINADRQEWWKDFWSASYVDFGTEDEKLNKVQKYYYGAQYILGSTAKEGELAPGLYGIWHTADGASWSSDYHLNYNFIATFYGTNSSNRPEIALPAVQALLDYVPEGQRRATSTAELKRINAEFVQKKIDKGDIDPENGIEGAILFPVGIAPWGMTTDNVYLNEALDAAYNSYTMSQYYAYTLDEDFMNAGAYDFMKQAVTFYESWLEKEEKAGAKDGYEYVLYAGFNEGSWAINPAVELAALKNTLRNLIKASEDMNKDADRREKWIDIYEHLGDQPTTMVNGKKVLALGEKQWNGSTWVDLPSPIPGDGNAIPLDCITPGGVYNYFSSPEDLQMVRDTVTVFSERGAWGQINNFPRLFPAAVKARYDIDTVVTKLVDVINSQMAPNLRINDWTHGVEKSGSTETINGMLLQSENGINKIFPNWYADKDAKFANLRAKDAFTLSAEYDGTAQEAKNVTVTSEKGKTMTLVSPWEEGAKVVDSKGNEVKTKIGLVPNWEVTENMTITFDTVAGETYRVEKALRSDKSVLEQVIKHAETFEQENATEAQWKAFQAEIAKAQAVLDKEDATQEEIGEAVATLKAAISEFDKSVADRANLSEVIDRAKTSFDQDDCTAEQWDAFQAKIAKAQAVFDNDEATSEELNNAAEVLNAEILEFKAVVADRATLKALIEDAKTSYDQDDYTAARWAAFQKEIARAQVALDKDNSSSEDVAKAITTLRQAIADLNSDGERDLPVAGMKVTAGSEENTSGSDYATNVLDGNPNTIWHTDWNGCDMADRWIDLELVEPTSVSGVRIQSRSGVANGMIKKADIFVKTADSEEYVQVADEAPFGSGWHQAIFDEVENVTNVKIQATETQGNWASAAEIRIVGPVQSSEAPEVDKTGLQAVVDEVKALNKDAYTAASWALVELKLEVAEAVLADAEATDYDVILAETNLRNAEAKLVEIAEDKDDLAGLIDYANSQKDSEDYKYVVPVVKKAFEKALAEAIAVNENAEATQAEVDAAYDNLLDMVHMLGFTGNSESLKALADSARGLNPDLFTEETWAVLEDALAAADAVLANENALQDEIDAARDVLQDAMDGLVRVPVDKDALKKLIDKAQKYVDKIDQYTDGTAKIFTDMLAEAVATYENEDASQKMVDAAYAELQQAIFQLRLKPNKDKLDDLIKAAEKVDTSKYTDESAVAFKLALDNAKAVFADGEATKEEVKAAEKALKDAQKNLVAKADKVASNDGNKDNKDDKAPVKTGDVTSVWTMLLVCMAAVATAGTIVIRRKRR